MPVTNRRRMDPVSKAPFVLEPGSGSGEQMWKQCSHWGEAVTEVAITDRADSTQQSQSAYCLSDICFALYTVQMGPTASGSLITLHITSVAAVCLHNLTVTALLCTSCIHDWPQVLLLGDVLYTLSVLVQLFICGILIMWKSECPVLKCLMWDSGPWQSQLRNNYTIYTHILLPHILNMKRPIFLYSFFSTNAKL